MKPIGLAIAAIAFATAAMAAEKLPALPRQQDYGQARKALQAQGWKPVHLADADDCQPGDRRCAGRPEMFACAGTGNAACVFVWRRGGTTIEVATVGEDRAVVSRVSCRDGCN